jgi:hypothetical protein
VPADLKSAMFLANRTQRILYFKSYKCVSSAEVAYFVFRVNVAIMSVVSFLPKIRVYIL